MILANLAPWLYGIIGFLTPIMTVLNSDVQFTTRTFVGMTCGAVVGACTALLKEFFEGDVVRTRARIFADAAKEKFNADKAKLPSP